MRLIIILTSVLQTAVALVFKTLVILTSVLQTAVAIVSKTNIILMSVLQTAVALVFKTIVMLTNKIFCERKLGNSKSFRGTKLDKFC